ncbi:hypothetical protein HOY82DRAFT_596476 [Tuber indicum]|nr:hypothetical protein HOY82DRAFT_596476 [Tuber indicum]
MQSSQKRPKNAAGVKLVPRGTLVLHVCSTYSIGLKPTRSIISALVVEVDDVGVRRNLGTISRNSWNVEEIVKCQINEMPQSPPVLRHIRGTHSLPPQDLIFLMSHDTGKVSRLRTYLSRKDVRKSARDNDLCVGAEVHDSADHPDDSVGPAPVEQNQEKTDLPWGMASLFSEQSYEIEEDEYEGAVEENAATQQRLRNGDEHSKSMTRDQYAFSIVKTLTEEELKVKMLKRKVPLGSRASLPMSRPGFFGGFLGFDTLRSRKRPTSGHKGMVEIVQGKDNVNPLQNR